jgi:hypothetical protein
VEGALSGTQAVGRTHLLCTVRSYNALKVRFSATLGEEPEIDLAWVIVPLCTESRLRFSALLHDGALEVGFERAIPG